MDWHLWNVDLEFNTLKISFINEDKVSFQKDAIGRTQLCMIVIKRNAAAAAMSLQSCPTLCDPIDGSPPGFPIPGILQARTLEWVAISFSNACKWKVKVKSPTPWSSVYQAPPSVGFSRQEYWSGVPLPSPKEMLQEYLLVLKTLKERTMDIKEKCHK